MKINQAKVITVLLLLVNGFSFAQTNVESKRLKAVHQFAMAVKQGTLSNGEIMKKYVVEGDYFKRDSIKSWADFYLNDVIRRCLKLGNDADIAIFKYSGREDKYSVTDRPIGEPERTQKLEFILYENLTAVKPTEKKIDINDLYVIEFIYKEKYTTEEGKLFILFNEHNKIRSFAYFPSNNFILLYQY
jgi:hypothetical protein